MANFLNRLAGRTLGAMPVAEPVVPARFSLAAARVGRPASDSIESPGESDYSATDQAGFRPAEMKPRTRTTTWRRETALPDEEDKDQPHVVQPDILHPPATAVTRAFWHDPQGTENSDTPPQADRTPQGEDLRHVTAHPVATQQAIPRTEGSSAETSADPNRRDARDPHRIVAERTRSEVPHAAPIVVQDARRTAHDQGSPSAAPTIRVTIGRIDVRAEVASPPPPTAARRTRASTLSLDQYLKQRSEAGR